MSRSTRARLLLPLLLAAVLQLSVPPALRAEALTQRDWMVALVDALGWSFGLPDEPQDPDYLNILSGNRSFRFEAEDIYSRDEDVATLMSFRSYGEFSGNGWLHGTTEPNLLHLRFTLPRSGDYLLSARLRGEGHRFEIAGATTAKSAGQHFETVEIGRFPLNAGRQEILMTLPPSGSIDHIALTAPGLPAIAPQRGWDPDAPLAWNAVQETLLSVLSLAETFPPTGTTIALEAEDAPQGGFAAVDIGYFGVPSGGRWLRAAPRAGEFHFEPTLPAAGHYHLVLRAMGEPIEVLIDDHLSVTQAGSASLQDHEFTALPLGPRSRIIVRIPAGGGIDRLALVRRDVSEAGTARLLGLNDSAPPGAADIDRLTRLLAAFGPTQ